MSVRLQGRQNDVKDPDEDHDYACCQFRALVPAQLAPEESDVAAHEEERERDEGAQGEDGDAEPEVARRHFKRLALWRERKLHLHWC